MTTPPESRLQADNERMRRALENLVDNVKAYPAWERPCLALDEAIAALAAAPDSDEWAEEHRDEWAGWEKSTLPVLPNSIFGKVTPCPLFTLHGEPDSNFGDIYSLGDKWYWRVGDTETTQADTAALARLEVTQRVKPAETVDKPLAVGDMVVSDAPSLEGVYPAMSDASIFTSTEPDCISELLGTGYLRFQAAGVVEGLMQESGGMLDILAIRSNQPREGNVRRFIEAAKERYVHIRMIEVWNDEFKAALARYGFTPTTLFMEDGEECSAMVWDQPAKEPQK